MLVTRIKTQLSVCMHRIEKIQPHAHTKSLLIQKRTKHKKQLAATTAEKMTNKNYEWFRQKRTKVLLLSSTVYTDFVTHIMRSLLFCVLVGLLIRDYISSIWVVFTHEIPHCSTPLMPPYPRRCCRRRCHHTVNLLSIRFLLVSFKHAWSVNQSIFSSGTNMTSIWHPLTATRFMQHEFYSSKRNIPEAILSTDYRIYSIYMRFKIDAWWFQSVGIFSIRI